MKCYRVGHRWLRTQAEAKALSKVGLGPWRQVEVPTDHEGLVQFLDGYTAGLLELSSRPETSLTPEPIVTGTMSTVLTPTEAALELRDWTLARARFRAPLEPTLLQRAELVRRYREESAQIFNPEEPLDESC